MTVCFVAIGLSAIVGGLMMIWTAVRQLSASPGAFIALGIVIIVVAAVWKLNSIFISPVLNLIVRDMVDVLQRNLGITKGNDKR